MELINSIMELIKVNIVTFIFMVLLGTFVWNLIRLHIRPEFDKFDLADMVTRHDGALDMGKFRITMVFFATTYAFFYILHNKMAEFTTYAAFYTALWLTHQVADKVTRTDKDKIQDKIQDKS